MWCYIKANFLLKSGTFLTDLWPLSSSVYCMLVCNCIWPGFYHQFQIRIFFKVCLSIQNKLNFIKADGKLSLTSPLYCVLIDFLLSELFNKPTLYMLINLSRLSVAHGCLKPMSELDHRGRASFNLGSSSRMTNSTFSASRQLITF